MRILILLALLGAVSALRQSSRIVGGSPTNIDQYPFMSVILDNSWMGLRQFCGGSLITNRAVLTAAHCFRRGVSAFLLKVRLGSTYASSGGSLIPVANINTHQQFNSRLFINDIAILRLSSAAVMSSQIDVARIAGPQYVLQDNTRLIAAGWGITSYHGMPSEVLQHVGVNLINQRLCTERYAFLKSQPGMSHWPNITPEMLCTGILDVGGKDACEGDSGGPIIHNRNVIVGITSWGYECAHPTYPGVNVRVSLYTKWIENNLN